jgi:formate hydrogenlyase subunit 3/multisubunit Na+/H+ antiporter MnhD subunit
MILGSLVAALVMQHTRQVSRELRIMGWVCTVYLVISNAISGVTTPAGFFDMLFFSGEINVWEHPDYLAHILITMAIELALALFGLYFLVKFRERGPKESQTVKTDPLEVPPAKDLFDERPGKEL